MAIHGKPNSGKSSGKRQASATGVSKSSKGAATSSAARAKAPGQVKKRAKARSSRK